MPPRFEQQTGPAGVPVVQGYTPTGWRVSGQHWPGGVLVTPEGTNALAGIAEADFVALTSDSVDVLLIGGGATMPRPDINLMAALRVRGISAEYMDSRAAARTYNVLANEGRRVGAALMPV